MFMYEKKLQYPVNIKNPNPKLAQIIITQYGGPDGELGASLRYLSQRFSMPYPELKGLLTDVGKRQLEEAKTQGVLWISALFMLTITNFHLSGISRSFTSMVLSL